MSVDLTELKISGDQIMPLDFGGLMPSALGGPTERISRLGNRYMVMVDTPSMQIEPHGRRWSARLLHGMRDGAIVEVHQPDLKIGAPGTPVVATTTASGRSIPVSGLTAGYVVREGQWLNYIVGGQRYLDQCTAEVVANGSGLAAITIQNLLRVPLTAGDSIELAKPCIEGWIEGELSLPRSVDRVTSFNFTITEKG